MNLFFKNPETLRRMQEGPLGKYMDNYAAELRAEGYAQQSAELQVRLVADFSRWLAKRRISTPQVTPAHFPTLLAIPSAVSASSARRPSSSEAALKSAASPRGNSRTFAASGDARRTVGRGISSLFAARTGARLNDADRLHAIR